MSIEGMDCPSCAVRAAKALGTIPSVTQQKVNVFAGEATLMYDTGAVSPDEIAQRVTRLTGFTCKFEQELREEDLLRTLWVSIPTKWDDNKLPNGVAIKSRKVTKSKENLLEVQYDSTVIQPRDVVAEFELWGGEYVPLEQVREPNQASKDLWELLQRTALSAIATIPILVLSWAPIPQRPILYGSISLVLATFVQFYVAQPLYHSSFYSLFRQHILDMDLLVAGSTTIAYIYSVLSFGFLAAGKPFDKSFFETSSLLVTLIMVGSLISAYATRRTTSALDAVDALQVRTVNLVDDDDIQSIPAELVHVGDTLQVSPDSIIPTDGVVWSGDTQVDESSLTGESKPVEKRRGSSVIAGTLNLSGSIEITVSRSLSENTIAGISRLMHDVQGSRIPIQDLADKVAAYFAPMVLALGLVTFLVWMLVGKFAQDRTMGKAGINALMKMITVLVVSCPCAICLCVPMVVIIAVSVAAKKGVLFKVRYAKLFINRILFTLLFYPVPISPSSLSNTPGTRQPSSSIRPARSQKETSRLPNSIPSPTTPHRWYTTSQRQAPTRSPKPSPNTLIPLSPPPQLPRSWEPSLPSPAKASKPNSVRGCYGAGTVDGWISETTTLSLHCAVNLGQFSL